MAINLATKYSGAIDEVISRESLTDRAINSDFDFVGAQTVKVYSFGTVPMNDYKASGENRYGTPSELEDSTQEMTMGKKRSFTFTIDKTYAVDSPEGVRDAGKALSRQLRGAVVPELDAYRLSVIAKNAASVSYDEITKENAYSVFLNANAEISDKEMPLDGRIAYISSKFYALIKQDETFVKASEIAQNMLISGQVGSLDGVALILTPSKRLPGGASFIITHPIACTSPVKLADYKIHQDPPGLAGHLVEGLIYYDAFVLNNKKNAIAVNFGHALTLTATMTASESGKGILTVQNASGGTLCFKAAASQKAAALGEDISSWDEIPENGEISASSGNKIAVALRDDNGKAIATAEVIAVVVGA